MKIVISFLVGVWFAWGFLKHYDVQKLRESYQTFDTGREAINKANEVYDKFKREVVIK